MSIGSAKSSGLYYGCCNCEDDFPDTITANMGSNWDEGEWPECDAADCQAMGGVQTLSATGSGDGCVYSTNPQDDWTWRKYFTGPLPICTSQSKGFGALVQCLHPYPGNPQLRYYFQVGLNYDFNSYTYEKEVLVPIDCRGGSLVLPLSNTPNNQHCIGWPASVTVTW